MEAAFLHTASLSAIPAATQLETHQLQQLITKKSSLSPEEKVAYWKTAQGFESIFLYMLLKEMRKTVPTSTPLLGGGILNTFADLQLAQQLGKAGQFGIAALAYEYFAQEPYDPATITQALQQIQQASAKQPAPHLQPAASSPMKSPNATDTPESGKSASVPPSEPKPIAGRPPRQSVDTWSSRPSPNSPAPSAPIDASLFAKLHAPDGISPIAQEVLRYHQQVAPYLSIIQRAAQRWHFDPALLKAIIIAESGGNPRAISPAGAKGLMQLMDQTAQLLGVQDPFDPEENIFGGTRYLAQLRDRYDNLELALAAYNAGPTVVDRYGGIPPYPETRRYLQRVSHIASLLGFPLSASPAAL